MNKLFWSEFHSNLHSPSNGAIEEWYDFAKEMLDFWAVVYYPFAVKISEKGMHYEDLKDSDIINKDWEEIRQFINEKENSDFPVYMAYEWQGNGADGDHNVFYLNNDQKPYFPIDYKELCELLPLNEAIAIPHHPGYVVGHRGKNWDTHDPRYSPFTEIYSSHGSSESADSDIPLNVHIHMGPRSSQGSVMSGLQKGNISGIICSGDNHCTSAISGNGFFGVWAKENTKEALFNAMLNRNVYGVTRNRIQLNYSINDYLMGNIIKENSYLLKAKIDVEAGKAIDRVEIIKNGIVEKCYVHSGSWERTYNKDKVRFKFELELGWGPDLRVYPDLYEKEWVGKVSTEGEIISVEKLWTSPGQKIVSQNKKELEFKSITRKSKAGKSKLSQKNYATPYIQNQSLIIEIEASYDSNIVVELNGNQYTYKVSEILEGTNCIALLKEARELAMDRFDFDHFYRSDPFWHNAYKALIHKGYPVEAYTLNLEHDVTNKEKDQDFVMVIVYQVDGERAWSSPIWIQ